MSIDFTAARWKRLKTNTREWWAGELDRPLIYIELSGYDAGRPEPEIPWYEITSSYDKSISSAAIVDRWDYELSTKKFLGDAYPHVMPYFGPGVLAACLGAQLKNADSTVWFRPQENLPIKDIRFVHSESDYWRQRILSLCAEAREYWDGLVQVDMTDLGGSLDVISTFRPNEGLLTDLYDAPDEVKRLTWETHEIWWRFFDEIVEMFSPRNPGHTSWGCMFSEETHYMLQCDFAYMISPEMFDEFVKPELAASCRKLKNAFYHLDGKGQLPHLDSLLSIPELKGIQWIPGEPFSDTVHWPEVYRKIRGAGKLTQMFSWQSEMGVEALDVIADQVGSAEGIAMAVLGTIEDEEKMMRFCEKYGAL